MMKRLSLFLCLCLLLTFGLVSCKPKETPIPDREYDEAEVLSAARSLIPPSADLNEIYWGAGIGASEAEGAFTSGGATEADPDDLERFGISSVAELKTKTAAVYSTGVTEQIGKTVLSPVYDGDSIIGHSRYFDAKDGDGTRLMVAKWENVLLNGSVTFDTDGIRVTRVKGQKVYVTVPATVTTKEGASMTDTLEIPLVEETDGWRLDAPTYLVYYEK